MRKIILLLSLCFLCGTSQFRWQSISTVSAQNDDGQLYLPVVANRSDVSGTPTPITTSETRTSVATSLYAGPGNSGFVVLATLPANTAVTPVGTYGDFVKVQTALTRSRAQEGYVWQSMLTNVPNNMPALDQAAMPWTERTIVPVDHPLHFDLLAEDYRRYPVFGTATNVKTDLALKVELAIAHTDSATDDASNGIFFGTSDGQRGVAMLYQFGGWRLFRYFDGSIVFSEVVRDMPESVGIFTLQLLQNNRRAVVQFSDGEQFGYDLGAQTFNDEDTAYLLVQVAPGSTVQLSNTTIEQVPSGNYDNVLGMAQPLRNLAPQHNITLGTFPDGAWYGTVLDHQLVARHADLQVWHLNWDDVANLTTSTRMAFAKVNNMRTRAHPLIWHEHLPAWLENGSFTPDELRTIMRDRITAAMTRYEADEWVVVNEAVANNDSTDAFVDNVFYRAFGERYIDMAFEFAREADPDAVLIYNDYGIEGPNLKADRTYDLLQRMLDGGVPVDGLGLQYHLLVCNDTISPKEDLLTNMSRFASLGIDLFVTELDVSVRYLSGTQQQKWAQQAAIYQDVTEACVETAACKSVTTWGFSDPYSWLYNHSCGGEAPLLFDDNYHPKPSFFAIERALTAETDPTPTPTPTATATPSTPSNEIAQIQAISGSPNIDGNVDALWSNANRYELGNVLEGGTLPAADLSGEFRALHDGSNLYFLIEITDDSLQNDSGTEWWKDDAIEIYLDGDKSQGSEYDGINDYQLVFRWNDSTVIQGPNSLAPPAGLTWEGVDTNDGYRIEVAIPLNEIGVTAGDDVEFGLDVQAMDDDDGGERDGKLAWHTTVDETWRNPSLFGVAQLNGDGLNPAADYHVWLRDHLQNEYGLTGGSWLFGDSEAQVIDTTFNYGSQSSARTVSVADQPFSQAIQVQVNSRTEVPWGTGQIVPYDAPVTAGDMILIALWLRSTHAEAGDGHLRVSFINRNSVAYTLMPTSAWQLVFIPVYVDSIDSAEEKYLNFQVGIQEQTLEIGGIAALNYGPNIAFDTLPETIFDQYEGESLDAEWRVAAAARIEQHRKGDLTVQVVDQDGLPIPNAHVDIQMQSHAFGFGSAYSIRNILGNSSDDAIYRQKIADLDGRGHGFNTGGMEWSLQWQPWEGYPGWNYTKEQIVDAVTWVRNQDISMRGHSMMWGSWRRTPADLEQNQGDPVYLKQRIDSRVSDALTYPGLAGEIFEWDVINEARTNTDVADAFAETPGYPTGEEIYAEMFKLAEQTDPNVNLFLNDYGILHEGGLLVGAQQRYHEIIRNLIANGGRLDGIGLQSHMRYPLTSPAHVYALLDDFAVYDKPLRITEYDVNIDDEQKAAAYTRDFMTIVFSHPVVLGFNIWNFWDGIHWLDNAPLFRTDWTLKPAGEQYIDLVFNQWWTDETGQTRDNGEYDTRGFLGNYIAEASYNGAISRASFELKPNGTTVQIVLNRDTPSTPALRIEAEAYDDQNGVQAWCCGGLGYLDDGDWARYDSVDFGNGVTDFEAYLAVPDDFAGKQIEVRVDSLDGPLLGVLTAQSTGSWDVYATQRIAVDSVNGIHDLYLIFRGGSGVCNLDWVQFTQTAPTATPSATSTATPTPTSTLVPTSTPTPTSPPSNNGRHNLFYGLEAEALDAHQGVEVFSAVIGFVDAEDWILFNDVDFGDGVTDFGAYLAVPDHSAGKQIEVRLDGVEGELMGTMTVQSTGSWDVYDWQYISINEIRGVHDLYFVFQGGFGVANIDRFRFAPVTAAAPNASIPAELFGMHIHRAISNGNWPTMSFDGWRLHDAQGLFWRLIEPAQDEWNFDFFDATVDLAEERGVELLYALGQTPAWAAARPDAPSAYGVPGSSSEPANLDDWRDYVRTVATRYRGKIKYYEIWNEADLEHFYSGDVATMLELAREAYTILKEIDPDIVVVSPSVVPYIDGMTWLHEYLDAGGGDYADVIGVHFYLADTSGPEDIPSWVLAVQQLMDDHGQGHKELWNTESNFGSFRNGVIVEGDDAVGYVARSYLIQWHAGVERFYWYAWDNKNFVGLDLTEDDEQTPTAAAVAYGEIYDWLVGTQMEECTIDGNFTWVCTLTDRNNNPAQIIWNPDRELNYPLPSGARYVRNLQGETQDISSTNSLAIGVMPAYIGFDDPAPPNPDIAQVLRTNASPRMDGLVDGVWEQARRYSLDNTIIGESVSTSDLSGEHRALHDGSQLYILMEISDDSLVNDSGEQWWEDDAVEIYLDGDHSQGTEYDGANDFQLVFRWNDDTVIPGPNSLSPPAGLRWERVATSNGYRVEVAIPLSEVDISDADGVEFGLDVQVLDDDDGGVRDTKLAWHTAVDETWHNPSLFGTAQLVSQSVSPSSWVDALPNDVQASILWHGDMEEGSLYDP